MKRDVLADRLKGYACLLVLFGHVLSGVRTAGIPTPAFFVGIERFLWSFHVDLFMFLSGYVFRITGGAAAKGSRLRFVGEKAINLGLPYILFSALYIAVNALTPGVNNPAALSDILRIGYAPIAQYWFIYALFWLFLLWAVLSRFLRYAVVTAILYVFFIVCRVCSIDLGFLYAAFGSVLAFGIGTCLPTLKPQKLPLFVRIGSVLLHIAIFYLFSRLGIAGVLFADDFLTLFGIFAAVCFISLLENCRLIAAFLDLVCRYAFPTYLLHTFFTAATRIALLRLGVTVYAVHLAAGTAVGLAGSLAIGWLAARSPYLNLVFYPTRSLRALRKAR